MFGSQLAKHFPDRPGPASLVENGSFGNSARMGRFMNFEVCASGLRVKPWALFGPYSQTFFVPWSQIRVQRKMGSSVNRAVLTFGDPEIDRLSIHAHVANRMARAVPEIWPEQGPVVNETPAQAFAAVARAWLLGNVAIAVLFFLVFRLAPQNGDQAPLGLLLIFPIVLGVVSVLSYRRRIQR